MIFILTVVNKLCLLPSLLDIGLSFISRTGKTHDFRKIKGWQGKFHNASGQEGKSLLLLVFALIVVAERKRFCKQKKIIILYV